MKTNLQNNISLFIFLCLILFIVAIFSRFDELDNQEKWKNNPEITKKDLEYIKQTFLKDKTLTGQLQKSSVLNEKQKKVSTYPKENKNQNTDEKVIEKAMDFLRKHE